MPMNQLGAHPQWVGLAVAFGTWRNGNGFADKFLQFIDINRLVAHGSPFHSNFESAFADNLLVGHYLFIIYI